MEGDQYFRIVSSTIFISIHSLRMEGDRFRAMRDPTEKSFQSTPSAWRETNFGKRFKMGSRYFNPLPPHGGRPIATIYLPGEGEFQSTPSAWRETYTARITAGGV